MAKHCTVRNEKGLHKSFQKLNTLVASLFLRIPKTISTSVIKLYCVNFGLKTSQLNRTQIDYIYGKY